MDAAEDVLPELPGKLPIDGLPPNWDASNPSGAVCVSEVSCAASGVSEVFSEAVGALKPNPPPPPPMFMLPITLISSVEASTSASLLRCSASMEGIVPSSCP